MIPNQIATPYSPVGIVGSFISRIFKKPQTTDGFGKFIRDLCTPGARYYFKALTELPSIQKFINRQPMTAKEKTECTKLVLKYSQNWTKAQKKDLQNELASIRIITKPKPKPVEVHTVSASSLQLGQESAIKKSGEVIQAGISKIPIYVLVGVGALLVLPKLLRMRGGKE